MTIFYTVPYSGKAKYQKQYDWILKAIQKTNVEIISPELDNYQQVLKPSELKKYHDPKIIHYESIRRGIDLADAVIIDVTQPGTRIGYEIGLAVFDKKYVLCLSLDEDFSEKINNRYVLGAQYTELTIDEIVEDFVAKVSKNILTERFNCFLSPAQVQYLQSASSVQNINMSEYVRELIDRDRKNLS